MSFVQRWLKALCLTAGLAVALCLASAAANDCTNQIATKDACPGCVALPPCSQWTSKLACETNNKQRLRLVGMYKCAGASQSKKDCVPEEENGLAKTEDCCVQRNCYWDADAIPSGACKSDASTEFIAASAAVYKSVDCQ